MDDQSRARLKAQAQALLTTIGTKDDPAEVFFDLLPTPEEIHGVTNADTHDAMNERFVNVLNAVGLFLQKHDRSQDPDFAYISNSVSEAAFKDQKSYMQCLRNSMAYVALMNSRNGEASSQGTKKDRLLAYYLWRLHGAKDETSPIQISASTRPTGTVDVASHDILPSSRTRRGSCSNCGNTQATSWCSGCCIMKSGNLVFATFYCDRDCMKAHWKTHKPSCKEARALRRAATIFTDLWFEDLRLKNGWDIESVTEENGLIEMKIISEELRTNQIPVPFRPLPRHLVESEEQALACVSAGTCQDVVEGGRLFFELFIRPACALVEAVHFQPKNAHKTVHVSYHNGKHDFLFLAFHVVLRITLPSGLRFAFDPSGAQNGWQEYLAPWDAYEQHRVHFIKDIRIVDPWGLMEWMRERNKRSETIIPVLVAVIERSLGLKLDDEGLKELLYSLPDSSFETKRESAVKACRELLMSCGTEVD